MGGWEYDLLSWSIKKVSSTRKTRRERGRGRGGEYEQNYAEKRNSVCKEEKKKKKKKNKKKREKKKKKEK